MYLAGRGPPTVTRNFTGSKVESFDLSSFYFGCDPATVEGLISSQLSCTVTVQGYRDGKDVVKQSFDFDGSLFLESRK